MGGGGEGVWEGGGDRRAAGRESRKGRSVSGERGSRCLTPTVSGIHSVLPLTRARTLLYIALSIRIHTGSMPGSFSSLLNSSVLSTESNAILKSTKQVYSPPFLYLPMSSRMTKALSRVPLPDWNPNCSLQISTVFLICLSMMADAHFASTQIRCIGR